MVARIARPCRWAALPALAAALAGCGDRIAADAPGHAAGRYAGIGAFDAGRLWSEIKGEPAATDPARARLDDDEHVIVVLDTHTGEVRECGDHSGFCVSINPWRGPAPALPAGLAKHAADLAREQRDAAAADAR